MPRLSLRWLLASLAIPFLLPALADAFPLQASDTPNDGGRSVSLTWSAPDPKPAQWILVRRERGGAFAPVATLDGNLSRYTDESGTIVDGTAYEYQLVAQPADPARNSEVSGTATPSPDWLDTTKSNVLVVTLLFFIVLFYTINQAHRGKRWTFRKIPGLIAIEEAIGRATEMGKGVLYIPGIQDIDDIQTIASMILLAQVSRLTAKYETKLSVPTNSPAVYTVADEVVKSGYQDVGRADAYQPDMVRYLTSEQFAYVAAVNGMMLRERPAATLLLGAFFAESLLLAETGHSIGAIQIAGTANVHQMPFFVVACDYTLIGEEYYAASALLSNDPLLLGSLKAADTVKFVLIVVIALGCVLSTLGNPSLGAWFSTR
ncbi:MAG TPA: DUF6754 domain-containing protein [Candidatus Eisenbacteria bacterium]|nr:DUF6754 domain-containing protein [Candidatus Eisenbacteria bacterium]